MVAIAFAEALDMMMFNGSFICSEPFASSLTPSLTLLTQRDSQSSLMVMGLEGSRRPWSTQSWSLYRLRGFMSTEKLWTRFLLAIKNSNIKQYSPGEIVISPFRSYDLVLGLPSIEPQRHFAMLLLTFMTSTGCLTLA